MPVVDMLFADDEDSHDEDSRASSRQPEERRIPDREGSEAAANAPPHCNSGTGMSNRVFLDRRKVCSQQSISSGAQQQQSTAAQQPQQQACNYCNIAILQYCNIFLCNIAMQYLCNIAIAILRKGSPRSTNALNFSYGAFLPLMTSLFE
jgi:hypothetical protein